MTTTVEFNWPRFLNTMVNRRSADVPFCWSQKESTSTTVLIILCCVVGDVTPVLPNVVMTIAYIFLPTEGVHQLQWKTKILKSTWFQECVKLSQAASCSGNRAHDCWFTCRKLHTITWWKMIHSCVWSYATFTKLAQENAHDKHRDQFEARSSKHH